MRCLVVQTAYLGDVILSVPLLELAREESGITWLGVVATPVGSEFVRGQELADEVIVFDKRGTDRGPFGFLRTARRIRAVEPDVALIPHRSFRSAALCAVASIPRRVGFDDSGGRMLLTKVLQYRALSHEAERVARLIEGVGGKLSGGRVPFELRIPRGASESASALLAGGGLSEASDIVVLAPGSAWPTKRWSAERFAEVGTALSEEYAARIVIVGTPDDRAAGRVVEASIGAVALNLTGETTTAELIAILARAKLLVGNDSAAVHLAAGIGTPVVAVFGPTVPQQGFAPYTDRASVVGADVQCRPCGRHGGRRCRRGVIECMDRVGSGEVLTAARALLDRIST